MPIKTGFITAIFIVTMMFAPAYGADNGLVTKKSENSVQATIDILEEALASKGIRIMARVDHQANAASVNKPLRPTRLLIFGNPKLGTPLMQSGQTAGIDLPMKALAWQDENGQVWLTYNDPAYIAARHGITDKNEVVKKMAGALNKFSNLATKRKK